MSAYQVLRDNGGDARDQPDQREAVRERRVPPQPPPGTAFSDLRRYWWVTLLVVLLAGAAAYVSTSSTSTTYTGRASLIVSSNNRSPDQDAVLVQGYVDYFNDTAYQRQLLQQAGLRTDVTLSARAAAASPILLIESTAGTPDDAEFSAAAVAEAFQTDINRVRDDQQQEQLSSLRERLNAATAAGGADSASNLATLQDQIAQVEADRVNRLQELQFRGGVSTNAPGQLSNLVFGLFGGLVLGLLASLALGRLVRLAKGPRLRRSA